MYRKGFFCTRLDNKKTHSIITANETLERDKSELKSYYKRTIQHLLIHLVSKVNDRYTFSLGSGAYTKYYT